MIAKYDYLHRFSYFYYKIKTQIWYKLFFRHIGKNSRIMKPLKINNPQDMIIEDNVLINKYTWLLTLKTDNYTPKLTIESNTIIGNYNHITCINNVHIGKNVLTADKVYISDNYHGYEDITIPIEQQSVKSKGEVYIGNNTWIGENVCIISSKIGKHCVIGANSVVNRDLPDYCVAVGAPIKIVKRFNKEKNIWQKTNSEGEFI